MYTMLLSPFPMRVATGCPCRERHGVSVADTPPGDSNKVAVKSPVPLTSRDFALAGAWCFGNLPVVRARTAVDRGLGWGESEFP